MSRVKLTEHKSKQLLYQQLGSPYGGISVEIDSEGNISSSTPLIKLSEKETYVVKVDQGVKGRMKKGLVKLRITKDELESAVEELARKGYKNFIIEEMLVYEQSQERYISIERVRDGLLVRYARVGGIDIESMKEQVHSSIITNYELRITKQTSNPDVKKISLELGVDLDFIQTLFDYFELNYVSFCEINPLVVEGENIHILDLAIEVDSTARYFVRDGWVEQDIVQDQHKSPEEQSIKMLNDNSQAALSFTLLNQNGSVWVLLSGGGASITLADEFYNLGHGKDIGNYGEYSGNPNAEETYLYTKEVLKALLKSISKKKILLIGGGVANFTDVRITFSGIIRAFEEAKEMMKKQKVLVFVRRGGPMQKEGLAMMETWLQTNGMYGYVAGPELPLYEIVRKVVKVL